MGKSTESGSPRGARTSPESEDLARSNTASGTTPVDVRDPCVDPMDVTMDAPKAKPGPPTVSGDPNPTTVGKLQSPAQHKTAPPSFIREEEIKSLAPEASSVATTSQFLKDDSNEGDDGEVDSTMDLVRGASVDDHSGVGILRSSPGVSGGSSPSQSGVFPVASWDRYEFLKLLGRGGMGAVYKARDLKIDRIVALKFVRGDDEHLLARFLQEARAQARINHPGVCKVLEVGEVEGKPYIAMQFVDGLSLAQARQVLSMEEKAAVIRAAAEALHAAHQAGIIHRDVKPANIMIEKRADQAWHPVVMDFGIAREGTDTGITESGAVLGTAAYMSPEQARGDVRSLDRQTDVYSLGASLFDLIAGRPPFVAVNMADTLLRVMLEDAPSLRSLVPSVPTALDTIVSKCLAKERTERYSTAQDLADDLGRYLARESIVGNKVSLLSKVRWKARHNRQLAIAASAFVASVLVLFGYGVRTWMKTKRTEELFKQRTEQQSRLAQKLGQEITKMEWLLRAARELPLHDLEREKGIVRQRMANLKTDMQQYGDLAVGLAHYALGRGHLTMHEYPEALTELQLAVQSGQDGPEVHYALGLTLGKLFEEAMYEARLSGGGEFAQKQLTQIAPKYLSPALRSLERARAMPLDAPQYLEALIAFYQRDYGTALKQAEVALQTAPWLYEATKLEGDVHLESALQARDSGKYEEAEVEFAAAVKKYSEAGAAGESDGEVFEGLAEAWVRKMEMDVDRGQPAGGAYDAAIAAGDKITAADSKSIAGHLKNSFAAEKTMSLVGGGKSSADRVERCLAEAQAVLQQKPDHPYAREMAANCYMFASELAQGRGEDPEPFLHKSLEMLEPAVKQNPQFLWGLNDLSTAYAVLGMYLQSKGDANTRRTFERALAFAERAIALDKMYLTPIQNSLYVWARLLSTASSEHDLTQMLVRADDLYAKCMKINDKYQQCNVNYLLVYSRAAQRITEGGLDPQAQLIRAFQLQKQIAKLGGSFLDAEQHTALIHYIDANEKQRKGQYPGEALNDAMGALKRCFAQADKDTLCRTIAAQTDWVRAELQVDEKKKMATLKEAQRKAEEATQSPEKTPDAWHVLAATHLRQARLNGLGAKEQNEYLVQGIGAVNRALQLNPNHAASRVTEGDLYLVQANAQNDPALRKTATQKAMQSYNKAISLDPYLTANISKRLSGLSVIPDHR